MQGTSAKHAEMTPVMLKSVLPHETQTELQNSLPLTPRPPIEGEPSGCKQEVADSVVMAGRTNGTVETAEPTIADIDRTALLGGELVERAARVDEGGEMDADVDRTPMLGGEPAMRDCGVNEGDGTERESKSRLQQTYFYCEEDHQRNGNAESNIPIAYGLPLEGEWSVYPSSESDMLIIVSIKLEDPHSGGIPRVHLRGTNWRAGNANGLGCRTDGSRSQADGPGGLTDAPSTSNGAETEVIGHGEGAGTYLAIGDTKRVIEVTDGVGSHADTSTGQGEALSIRTDAIIPANALEDVRTPRKKEKLPDLPSQSGRRAPDEPDGCGNHANALSVHTDAYTVETETETAVNETEIVRTHRKMSETQNSPVMRETATHEPTR